MNNQNQYQSNPQLKGMDPSKLPLSFNPQNLASLTGTQFLPGMANLTSAFGSGNAPTDSFGSFHAGDVTQSELTKKLKEKFVEMKDEVEKMEKNPEKFKSHQLPLARIKKIMKSDEDVRMISAEAPVLFAKACELFIIELTQRAWLHTEEGKRRTLQKTDVAQCIANTDIYDFLIDIIPREEYAKTAVLKKSSMANSFANPMPYGLPPGMPGMGNFNPQMMGNVNPNPQLPGGNKNQNTAFMQNNPMLMQQLGMMGGYLDKNAAQSKENE